MVINMNTTIPKGGEGAFEMSFLLPQEGSGPGVTLYEKELNAYSCVARGECENVRRAAGNLIEAKLMNGLGVAETEELKYRACEIINIAARYAAQSGAEEGFCLNFADESVAAIDRLVSRDDICHTLIEKTAELTGYVAQAKRSSSYPYAIRKAIGYINTNLARNLSVIDVADYCSLSPDYLSAYFKKITGEKMTAYIRKRKMQLARDMLGRHLRCADVAGRLSFCSESYFVKCFREEFGVTPKKWQSGI